VWKMQYLKLNLPRRWPIDKTHGLDTEDLLVANPNRATTSDIGNEEEDCPSNS
jgi:hypothetical protein